MGLIRYSSIIELVQFLENWNGKLYSIIQHEGQIMPYDQRVHAKLPKMLEQAKQEIVNNAIMS